MCVNKAYIRIPIANPRNLCGHIKPWKAFSPYPVAKIKTYVNGTPTTDIISGFRLAHSHINWAFNWNHTPVCPIKNNKQVIRKYFKLIFMSLKHKPNIWLFQHINLFMCKWTTRQWILGKQRLCILTVRLRYCLINLRPFWNAEKDNETCLEGSWEIRTFFLHINFVNL